MNILITGGAGFIGSRLAHWITKHHPAAAVTCIDNLAGGFPENVPTAARFVEMDLAVPDSTPVYSFEPETILFHCAAYASEMHSANHRRHTIRNVWEVTAGLINAAISRPIKRIVNLSSCAVYGFAAAPHREDTEPWPADPYGIAKRAAEQDLQTAARNHGLQFTTLRLHNVYGAGQNIWDDTRNVFGIWIRAALEGRPLRIYGDGQQTRQFTHIDDLLPALWNAGTLPETRNQTFNVGTEETTTIAAAALITARITGADRCEYAPARPEIAHVSADNSTGNQTLGFCASTDLAAGLASMWEWAREAWQKYPNRRYFRGPRPEFLQATTPGK